MHKRVNVIGLAAARFNRNRCVITAEDETMWTKSASDV